MGNASKQLCTNWHTTVSMIKDIITAVELIKVRRTVTISRKVINTFKYWSLLKSLKTALRIITYVPPRKSNAHSRVIYRLLNILREIIKAAAQSQKNSVTFPCSWWRAIIWSHIWYIGINIYASYTHIAKPWHTFDNCCWGTRLHRFHLSKLMKEKNINGTYVLRNG
jgi:hypothetical protein